MTRHGPMVRPLFQLQSQNSSREFHWHNAGSIHLVSPVWIVYAVTGSVALLALRCPVGDMASSFSQLLSQGLAWVSSSAPRPGLHPIPGSVPLTFEAALCPPLLYYVALLFLPPPPPPVVDTWASKALRNVLALTAAVLFFRLPLVYHVPQSIGLTYQLGLVGWYGGCRVVDTFFISRCLLGHVPRRVKYKYIPRTEPPEPEEVTKGKPWSDGGVKDPFAPRTVFNRTAKVNGVINRPARLLSHYPLIPPDSVASASSRNPESAGRRRPSLAFITRTFSGPDPQSVYESAMTEDGWPHSFADRAAWALELELSMRGVGFTWTTADVRHTRKTWLPSVTNRVHSIAVHVAPVLLVSWATIKSVYTGYLADSADTAWGPNARHPFDERLPLRLQLALTAALGAFLMSIFSLGHSLFAIMLSPLAPSPLAFFPPLYTTRAWNITSVREFWSFCWHRLFARFFLVYGVWPGEWMERKLTGKSNDEPADVGKVLGAFASSALVHSFSVRGVLAGDWRSAAGEARFFMLNGVAVVLEGGVQRAARRWRKQRQLPEKMWYDAWIGRAWWIAVLLFTGRDLARGWVKAGLVREIAFM